MDVTKRNPTREKLAEIIFESDTQEGKLFDVILLISILASILIVILETVPSLNTKYGDIFYLLEWIFTIIFTVEYAMRIYVVYRPRKYIFSFYGIVDLVSILPTYLSFFIAGSQQLMVIRALRLLRVFRIFKLGSFLSPAKHIMQSLVRSVPKIAVFLSAMLVMVIIIGSLMYMIEADVNPEYDSIPRSIYWTIVTITTVGYGDITPVTNVGQFISAIIMLLGYAIIAVPTGIISTEFIRGDAQVLDAVQEKVHLNTRVCKFCAADEHQDGAKFCYECGEELGEPC